MGGSQDSVLARARALHGAIAARADEAERGRRMPADLARTIAEAGLFRTCVPRSIGGLESTPAEILGVIEAVAEADASAGWCVMIASTTGLLSGYLPMPLAQAMFGDPLAITGGVVAPMGKAVAEGDAYRVSGRWKWVSGGQNATWLGGGCLIEEDGRLRTFANGAPDHRMMLFPAAEANLIDTWHTAGLCGTGSLDMAVKDLRVPRDRTVSIMTDRPVASGALYAFPLFGLLALGIAAVASGNARAALDAFRDLATAKRPDGGKRTLAERGTIQALFAHATAKLSAARAYLFQSVEAAWAEAQAGGAIGLDGRAALRLSATHMARTAAEVVREVQDAAGGSAVFLDQALQRRLRDAQTMTAHVMVAPGTYELAARPLLGLPTDASML
ncbi:acyl-CoA dehydrogenase family protein [Zavarzinia sp. CC-PAN008]|uniref:acyl-CoA dehydrogenase family protein n=1 Tax=Zavarzinia sp. CC-PAN008 TaxID=3243332 RepID=UPI003F7477A5